METPYIYGHHMTQINNYQSCPSVVVVTCTKQTVNSLLRSHLLFLLTLLIYQLIGLLLTIKGTKNR